MSAVNVSVSDASLALVPSRLRLGWMGSVKVALGSRGMMVDATLQCVEVRNEWRSLVHM